MGLTNLPPAIASHHNLNALANTFEQALTLPVQQLMPTLVDVCPDDYLVYLAQNLGLIDEPIWQLAESTEKQSTLIKTSVEFHRLKGTPQSIINLLTLLGQSDAIIEQSPNKQTRNGRVSRNGLYRHGTTEQSWAEWRVFLQRSITIDQAKTLYQALIKTAPARSRLVSINYKQASQRHNGLITRNGSYTRGSVATQLGA